VVTANAAGTATITATTADGNKTSACTIIVNKPVTYTITFDANSGVGAPNAQTKVSNSMLTLTTTTPTREGFVFKGWATTKTATEPEYKPGDSFGINKDTTLYAVWISDISLDGIVGTEDVSLLAGYLIGNTSLSSKQIEAADVYGNDGLISIKDLIALAQLISAQKA